MVRKPGCRRQPHLVAGADGIPGGHVVEGLSDHLGLLVSGLLLPGLLVSGDRLGRTGELAVQELRDGAGHGDGRSGCRLRSSTVRRDDRETNCQDLL